MSNRPAGGARSQKWERSNYDWYIEPSWAVHQIFDALRFGPPECRDLIYDPACGTGNVLDVAKERGHATFGSDVIDRKPRHHFSRGNFLQLQNVPKPPAGHALSIITNPPYSYQPDIAEHIIRRALSMPIHRAAFILPIAFMCGQSRWRFFAREFKPSHTLIYSQRPTMPPGDLIETMADPFKGGMADYCVLVWTFPFNFRTETIWLKPD